MTSEKRVQKFQTDGSITIQIGAVLLIGWIKFPTWHEISGSVTKCRLFSLVNLAARFLILYIFLPLSVVKVEEGKEKRLSTWRLNCSVMIINNYWSIIIINLLFCNCRPLSGSVLVVGCDNGLFVWTVDPSSPVVRLVHVHQLVWCP